MHCSINKGPDDDYYQHWETNHMEEHPVFWWEWVSTVRLLDLASTPPISRNTKRKSMPQIQVHFLPCRGKHASLYPVGNITAFLSRLRVMGRLEMYSNTDARALKWKRLAVRGGNVQYEEEYIEAKNKRKLGNTFKIPGQKRNRARKCLIVEEENNVKRAVSCLRVPSSSSGHQRDRQGQNVKWQMSTWQEYCFSQLLMVREKMKQLVMTFSFC